MSDDHSRDAITDDGIHVVSDEISEWFKEMRGWLMVLATLAASVMYQAGLNPPGGFSQDSNGHIFVRRYLTFYYFNATAFLMSTVIIILLLNERFYKSEIKMGALMLTTMIDLMSLVCAYIAGSTRDKNISINMIVLTCILFACVIYFFRLLPTLCFILLCISPRLCGLVKKGFLPGTENVRKRVEAAKERERKKENDRQGNTHTTRRISCTCCAACCRAFDDVENRALPTTEEN